MNTATRRLRGIGVAGLLLAAGCMIVPPGTTPGAPRETVSAPVHHVVVCWLKEPGNPEAGQKLIDVSRGFASIPGVIEVSAGRVLPSTRAIVDSTFDVAIVMRFASPAAMAAYLEHPQHAQALRDVLQPLTKRILVYDFTE